MKYLKYVWLKIKGPKYKNGHKFYAMGELLTVSSSYIADFQSHSYNINDGKYLMSETVVKSYTEDPLKSLKAQIKSNVFKKQSKVILAQEIITMEDCKKIPYLRKNKEFMRLLYKYIDACARKLKELE